MPSLEPAQMEGGSFPGPEAPIVSLAPSVRTLGPKPVPGFADALTQARPRPQYLSPNIL